MKVRMSEDHKEWLLKFGAGACDKEWEEYRQHLNGLVEAGDQWKERAENLWGILDDIDSSSDAIKPRDLEGYKAFYEATMRRVARRHAVLESDGYLLYVPGTLTAGGEATVGAKFGKPPAKSEEGQ